jgi:hypothetical protein
VSSARYVLVTFQPVQYRVTVRTEGTGHGTISTPDTDPDIACADGVGACSGFVTNGTTVTLTAAPAAGSVVSSWSGCTPSADLLTCTRTINSARTVTAKFQATVASP